MPNKAVKIRSRIRFDALYMVAALFAGIGGYSLLGSYADSKMPPTLKAGVYKLANYEHDGHYQMDFKQGLHYCFSPYNSSGTNPSATQAGQSFEIQLSQVDASTACFIPKADRLYVKVNFAPTGQKPITVTVQ